MIFDSVALQWKRCFLCLRIHLDEFPCLNIEQQEKAMRFPCYWINDAPYLFHECIKDLKKVEEEMYKRICHKNKYDDEEEDYE